MPPALFAIVFFTDLLAADVFHQSKFADGRGLHPTNDVVEERDVLVKERRGGDEVTKVKGKIVKIFQ